MLSWW